LSKSTIKESIISLISRSGDNRIQLPVYSIEEEKTMKVSTYPVYLSLPFLNSRKVEQSFAQSNNLVDELSVNYNLPDDNENIDINLPYNANENIEHNLPSDDDNDKLSVNEKYNLPR
jgi:hypothetical protein